MKIALVAFTAGGRALAARIAHVRSADEVVFFDKQLPLEEWVRRAFAACDALCFVGAAGIAVRLVAPLVRAKDRDPAVLAADEAGRFVIPLLSGHIGGANRLAEELAGALGATAVITSATDIRGLFAVDEWSARSGCALGDIRHIKDISAALLRGEKVGFHSDYPVCGTLPAGLVQENSRPGAARAAGVCVSLDGTKTPFPLTLNVIPRILTLGAGCRKNTAKETFESFITDTMRAAGLSPKALKAIATVDVKKNEPCLAAFAETYELDFLSFPADVLRETEGEFSGSDFVRSVVGVDNVCERAALAAGGVRLLLPKTTGRGISMALAVSGWICRF